MDVRGMMERTKLSGYLKKLKLLKESAMKRYPEYSEEDIMTIPRIRSLADEISKMRNLFRERRL